MSIASIQKIAEVKKHPNADALDIIRVLNYECIVKRNEYKVGDLVVFIEPDTVLPDKPWAAFYKAKSNRVKAIKLRGEWSFGIVESLKKLGLDNPNEYAFIEGDDIAQLLGVIKYEPPQPQDLNAKGPLPFNICKTDETRWQGLEDIPYGEVCDITLKVDGQSWSAYYKDGQMGILGRTMEYKTDCVNKYTQNEKLYDVLNKLRTFCEKHRVNLCIRGEQYGQGIQSGNYNPHSKLSLGLAFFSCWNIDKREYERKGNLFYIFNIAKELGLPTVPILEENIVLTKELIQKYSIEIKDINGKPFEGVVVNHANGSFKIINFHYDQQK